MKNRFWILKQRTKELGYSYEVKEKFRYVKGSVIAILLGLLGAALIVGVQNVNPFLYLVNLFAISFNPLYINQTIQWISIYLIAGLAIAISFKSGSFNIGVAGQMMLGAGLSIIFIQEGLINQGLTVNAGHIIAMLLICIVSGMLVSGLAGALKAFFNIHEVVTTIMLNWTIWYLFKYLFTTFSATLGGNGIATSASIPSDLLTVGNSAIILPVLIALLTLVVVGILLSRTVFGFKVKAVGLSQDASKYAGYNVKQKIIQAMILSGALAGLASFLNITTITPNLNFAVDNLPQIGYDSIAISLVAFNNPVGILFTSFLWGTLQSSGTSTASLFGVPPQLSALIFGVIVYFAAISVVFMDYYPTMKMRIAMAVMHSRKNRIQIKNLQRELLVQRLRLVKINQEKPIIDFRQEITVAKNYAVGEFERTKRSFKDRQKLSNKLSKLRNDLNTFIREYRNLILLNIRSLRRQISLLKKDTYVEQLNQAKAGINYRHFNQIRHWEGQALQKIGLFHNDRLIETDRLKHELHQRINYVAIEQKKAKAAYQGALKANQYWYEGQVGELTKYYEMFNTKIENQGSIKKAEILLKNDLSSLKADWRFERAQLLLSKEKDRTALNKINEEMKRLKKNYKEYRVVKNQEIVAKKKLYRQTKANLKQTDQLMNIQFELDKQNEIANLTYQKTLSLIHNNEILIKNKVDDANSKKQWLALNKVWDDYRVAKTKRCKNVAEAKAEVVKLNKMLTKIQTLAPNTFEDYDSQAMVKKKTHFFQKLKREVEQINSQVIIVATEVAIKQSRRENEALIIAYNDQIKKINRAYKVNVKAIENDGSLQEYERSEQLIFQEDFYNNEVEMMVSKLEETYLTEQKVEVF